MTPRPGMAVPLEGRIRNSSSPGTAVTGRPRPREEPSDMEVEVDCDAGMEKVKPAMELEAEDIVTLVES